MPAGDGPTENRRYAGFPLHSGGFCFVFREGVVFFQRRGPYATV